MPRARALHARVSVFASVLVTLVATLSCATQTKVTRLTPGTYQLECKDSLAVCLVAARELCREYGYDVISGTERRDYIEQEPQGYESVKANATVRCRQAVPLFGQDPNLPAAPSASAAASVAPAPAPSAAPPVVAPAASVAPVSSAPPASPSSPAPPSLDGGAP